MTSSCYDFNNFYLALQQSALFYSNVALRQKQVGYQYPLPLNSFVDVGSVPKPSQKNQQPPQSINLRKLRGTNVKIVCPVPVRPPRLLRPPPVMISTEENYSMQVNFSQDMNNTLNSSKRKVNFAQPLFTVKIKSPTPLHSLEHPMMGGGTMGVWGPPSSPAREGMNVIETESSADENETLTATSASVSEGNGNLAMEMDYLLKEDFSESVLAEQSYSVPAKKRKKSKRRKSRKRLFEDDGGGDGGFQAFDNDDPESYENQVNPDDYEFISEIRLCTKEDIENSSKKSNQRDENTQLQTQLELERKEEMNKLYGLVGAGRIIRMEDRVEETFQKELRRIK